MVNPQIFAITCLYSSSLLSPSAFANPPSTQIQIAQAAQPEMIQRSDLGLNFILKGCQKSSKGVRCSLLIHNTSEYDREVYFPSPNFIKIIDDEGNAYLGRSLSIANSYERALIPPDVKTKLNLLFQPNGTLTNQIKILELKPRVVNHNFTVQFRDFSIVSSSPQTSQTPIASDCRTAVRSTQQRLEGVSNIQQVNVRLGDITQQYPDHPRERTQSFTFAMKGKSVESVMNSSNLMTALAQPILKNCDAVGLVTFALANSGYGISIGILDSDRIGKFACLEHQINAPRPAWGEEFCSL